MPLENTSTVDAISIEPETGAVVLSIFDAWDWSDERAHLSALQAKLNSYFDFIQSGQIRESYPKAQGRQLKIQLVTQAPLTDNGSEFLKRAAMVASELDVIICHLHLK